jgi:RNA polymerase sigma-70 factor (ECF subfamily)
MASHDYNHVRTLLGPTNEAECKGIHLNNLQEARTIRRAQRGDAAAFARIYKLHSRRVYALCLRMVGNPAEAEDLTQEAFLRVFRKIQTFRGESTFSTWLHRLALNVVLMQLRKKKLALASLDDVSKRDEERTGSGREVGGPDSLLAGLIDRVSLERALGQLSTAQKTVFVLHDVHGYKHHEIAEMMDSSVGTSKGQLHRARARLRDLLRESLNVCTGRLPDFVWAAP